MKRKFQIEDKVVITKRCPFFISESIRKSRKRTIIDSFYDEGKQCTNYYLGSNKIGEDISAYPFRSYQLEKAQERDKGRPRLKRHYNRREQEAR